MDINNILQAGFDCTLVGLDIFEVGSLRVQARIKVSEALENFFGVLHGGAIATLVDNIGSIAIITADHYNRPGVTTDLNVSYFVSAKTGDSVLIEAEVLTCGLMLAFADVTLRREQDGKLLARGRITKFLGKKKSDFLDNQG